MATSFFALIITREPYKCNTKKKLIMKKKAFEEFKENYCLNSGSLKWIPKGGELLKLIGQEMIFVEFKKQPDGSFISTNRPVLLEWMGNFDTITMTYEVKYSFPEEPEKKYTEKIIPEGFSFDIMGQGLQDTMNRFVPLSLHAALIDEEHYFMRAKKLWDTRKTLPFTAIRDLNESKEQAKTLGYARNLVAAIKNEQEFYLFRIGQIKLRHDFKDIWRLMIYDQDNKCYSVQISCEKEEDSHEFFVGEEFIGDLKIIDLIDEDSH